MPIRLSCCAVLCCAVLRCVALRCVVLCCVVLCCVVLCCVVLCCVVLCCVVLCCVVLCCVVLCCVVLCCVVLCCVVLCCVVFWLMLCCVPSKGQALVKMLAHAAQKTGLSAVSPPRLAALHADMAAGCHVPMRCFEVVSLGCNDARLHDWFYGKAVFGTRYALMVDTSSNTVYMRLPLLV